MAALGLAFRSASLSAQDVPVTTSGVVSVTNALPPIYNGQYVLQTTDFGFLWLDTVALQSGLVEAEAQCGNGLPPSASNIYVTGDCNGTGNISSSGGVVLVRQFNSQCGAATKGCGGPIIRGPARLTFALGTWKYLGDGGNIADSTQTADPQGRTWTVQPVNSNGRNFIWHASGDPNAPPIAAATATNLSAVTRTDKTNYYGDKWQLVDASTPSGSITRLDWDFLYQTFFSPDEVGAPATEVTVAGYFPCDPSGSVTGTIRSGANCMQSLGLTNPAAPNSYRFAMQSANTNGTSAAPFISGPVPVVCPQANILGYAGFSGTCAKTAGTLSVLAGGSADASASQGNLAEASIGWSFTGQNPISVQGAIVPVPSGATGFTLTITYPGGYKATAQGNVVQASLIPAFSVAPDPVLLNTSLTLTNQMQMASATLDSVNYVVSQGVCSSPVSGFTSSAQMPASFLAIGGNASLQAPASVGGYCVNLKYNYRPQGQLQQSQVISNPFSAMNWSASPQIGISPVPFCTSSCQLQAGTAYSLWDSEGITVSPHPDAQWDIGGNPIGTSSDANVPISWTPTSACSSCTLRVTVNGSVAILPVTVSALVPPTPTRTPTSTPTSTAVPPTSTPTRTPTSIATQPPPTSTPTPTPTRTPTPPVSGVKGDFDGDGKPDIVLRNYATGQNAVWLMDGTVFRAIVDLPALPNANYRNEGVDGFNSGEGKMDIVWRNYSTGQNAVWMMNGTTFSGIVDFPALPNTAYHIEAVGDFNGDGQPDIVLRNYTTGQNAVWLMNGSTLMGIVDLPALSNVNYQIAGVGDFNGDGKMDIVWRNYATGQDALWLMNGTTLMSIVDLPALSNVNYRFEAVADYNGDGKPDIVLRNYATGQNAIWIMNGTSLATIVDLPALTNTNWAIAGPK